MEVEPRYLLFQIVLLFKKGTLIFLTNEWYYMDPILIAQHSSRAPIIIVYIYIYIYMEVVTLKTYFITNSRAGVSRNLKSRRNERGRNYI